MMDHNCNDANKCICWTLPSSSKYYHPFRREMEEGFVGAATDVDYSFMTIMVPPNDYDNRTEKILLNLFEKRMISGVILTAEKYIEMATLNNIPYVMTVQSQKEDIWSVDFNPPQSYQWLIECLTDLRHKHIAFITNSIHAKDIEVRNTDLSSIKKSELTVDGATKLIQRYHECVQADLIDGRPEWFTITNMLDEKTPEKIGNWYRTLQVKPSAIIIADANLAWKVVQNFRENGIKVPEDVSIMGSGSSLVNSDLSMWEIPFTKGAEACIRMIKSQIDDNTIHPRQEEVCGRLRLGKTIKPFVEE